MDNVEIPRLIYMALLLVAVIGWFIAENRDSLGKTLRMAIIWFLIFIGAIAAVGLWQDVRHSVSPSVLISDGSGRIEVPRARDGHYYLTLQLNDTPVDFVVDTGASDLVLTQADARRIGIDPDDLRFSGVARTANGEVRIASARINEIRLGNIVDENVRVSVNEGAMPGSLLGMSYLQRFGRIEISGGTLVLDR